MQDVKITDNILINFLVSPKKRLFRYVLLIILLAIMSVSHMMIISDEGINDPVLFTVGSLVYLILNLCAAYFIIYRIVPRFLLREKYLAFAVCLLGVVLFCVAGEFLTEYIFVYVYRFMPGEYSYLSSKNILPITMLSSAVAYGIGMLGVSFTVLLQHWMASGRRVHELENMSLHSELEQLKNQVNPDFLFNMLNEAAKLAKSNPEQVSQLFTQLSKILRYQLYDSNRERVLLHTDILFLENMLNLQAMRSKGLTYSLSEDGDTAHTLVPPLLFSSFVEYIIKLTPENAEQTHIQIHFQTINNKLSFTCIGSGLSYLQHKNGADSTIERAKRRLELLFHDSYTLKLIAHESACTINLTIYV